MKCSDIIRILQKLAPEELACDWDNVGLLLGRADKNISRVLIALEMTEEVADMAISQQADMVITHHPVIFHPLKRINSEDFIGRRILMLLRYDIACYAMHTNFDKAAQGMGTLAAGRLGLSDPRVLDEAVTDTGKNGKEELCGLGRIGHLNQGLKLGELCARINRAFPNEGLRVFAPEHKKDAVITEAAVLPGSGGAYAELAAEGGADVLITGDVSHHQGADAVSQDMIVIDVGHYALEYPFVEYLERYLSEAVSADVEISTAPYAPPYSFVGGNDDNDLLS